jgi:MATE family multidrug resistance protein
MRISVALHWGFAVIAWFAIKRFAVPPVTMWVIFIGFVITLGAAMYLRYHFGPWAGYELGGG